MNVGLYTGAAGMRVGEDYQQLISENLSLQSVPGYKQTFPVFSTDPTMADDGAADEQCGQPGSDQDDADDRFFAGTGAANRQSL